MLHNRIYIPVTTADCFMQKEHEVNLDLIAQMREIRADEIGPEADREPTIQAIFVLYHPRDLERFAEAAVSLLPDFWHVADFSDAFSGVITSMDSMLEIADLILLLAVGATMITLTLTITLLIRERQQEIGIYMALGDKKFNILTQFLIEIFLIAIVGIGLALVTGNILSSHISRTMIEQTLVEQVVDTPNQIPWELVLFNPANLPIEEVMEMYDTSLNIQTVAIFVGISLGVILISIIIPIIKIVKTNPKKVLM